MTMQTQSGVMTEITRATELTLSEAVGPGGPADSLRATSELLPEDAVAASYIAALLDANDLDAVVDFVWEDVA
jgi:hypothetical protein